MGRLLVTGNDTGKVTIVALLLAGALGFFVVGGEVIASALIGLLSGILIPKDKGRAHDRFPRIVNRKTPAEGVPAFVEREVTARTRKRLGSKNEGEGRGEDK
jgi:hypothetical protein